MKCIKYVEKLKREGWKVISREGSKLTLSKGNQQKVINLLFDTSVKATGSGSGWTSSENIVSSDNQYASYTLSAESLSAFLYAYNFGFAIPDGSTINNIEVKIERKSNIENAVRDDDIVIGTYGGTYYTNKSGNGIWPTSDTVQSFSYSPTNWGWAAITPALINSSNFAFRLRCYETWGLTPIASIDYIEITVTYTPPANLANLKTVNGLAKASVKTINGLVIASIKTWNGLT